MENINTYRTNIVHQLIERKTQSLKMLGSKRE